MEDSVRYETLDFLSYRGYRVGTDGSVWSCKRTNGRCDSHWKRLTPYPHRKGYLLVRLCDNGRHCMYKIHNLVLLAFVGPRPEGYVARHFPDSDRKNNNLGNLSWSTTERNQQDRLFHGTDSRGEKSSRAKLTNAKVLQMRNLYASGNWSHRKLARLFGVHHATVYSVITRTRWFHI